MFKRTKRYFISGLIVFLPLALTMYLLMVTITLADGFLGKYLKPYFLENFGFYVRGISILANILFIIFIGFLTTHFIDKRLYAGVERLLLRLPFFKQVYPAFKELAMFLFSREEMAFTKVVLVEYPRKGVYSIGFLTNDSLRKVNQTLNGEFYNVLIPTIPNPISGFVILVPKNEVVFMDISVEEAVKYIMSAGVVLPG